MNVEEAAARLRVALRFMHRRCPGCGGQWTDRTRMHCSDACRDAPASDCLLCEHCQRGAGWRVCWNGPDDIEAVCESCYETLLPGHRRPPERSVPAPVPQVGKAVGKST